MRRARVFRREIEFEDDDDIPFPRYENSSAVPFHLLRNDLGEVETE